MVFLSVLNFYFTVTGILCLGRFAWEVGCSAVGW